MSFIYFAEKWCISGIAIVWNQHYETNRMKYDISVSMHIYAMAFGMVPAFSLNERTTVKHNTRHDPEIRISVEIRLRKTNVYPIIIVIESNSNYF